MIRYNFLPSEVLKDMSQSSTLIPQRGLIINDPDCGVYFHFKNISNFQVTVTIVSESFDVLKQNIRKYVMDGHKEVLTGTIQVDKRNKGDHSIYIDVDYQNSVLAQATYFKDYQHTREFYFDREIVEKP